ncbi:MAG: LemA family protein [Synergistaceae bacterium]|jgi:LemA protein|nr:LemA family protein [Synergistaceae bacterium]
MSAISITVAVAIMALAVLLWGISVYNKLIRLSNHKEEAWSGVDIQLKRRFDLVPNLVETVKGYATHERNTLEAVIVARSAVTAATTQDARIEAENSLTHTLKSLFALSESYPELKANANFSNLQDELSSLESDLQLARRYYNGTVRDFNIAIQSFPAVLISSNLGYTPSSMFGIEDEEREPVKVRF